MRIKILAAYMVTKVTQNIQLSSQVAKCSLILHKFKSLFYLSDLLLGIKRLAQALGRCKHGSFRGWAKDNDKVHDVFIQHKVNVFDHSILACTAIAMSAEDTEATSRRARFDTDSVKWGIDNRASYCISHDKKDFVGPLTRVPKSIVTFGGRKIDEVYRGTIRFRWEDDDGKVHTRDIPGSYYVPQGNTRLFSPQHFCQIVDNRYQNNDPTVEPICETTSSKIVLRWNRRRHTKTIAIDPGSNVGNIYSAPGYHQFQAYSAEFFTELENENNVTVCESEIAPKVEQDDDSDADQPVHVEPPTEWRAVNEPHELNLDGPVIPAVSNTVVRDEELRQPTTAMSEFLQYHQRFGHIPMNKIRAMSQKGIIPPYLHKQVKEDPVCTACFYAKMKRRPWRSKIPKVKPSKLPTAPGDIVSVDQLISQTPGLIAQLTIPMTKQRYTQQLFMLTNQLVWGTFTSRRGLRQMKHWRARQHLKDLHQVMALELNITMPTMESLLATSGDQQLRCSIRQYHMLEWVHTIKTVEQNGEFRSYKIWHGQ
jgi:hypothetical protein